MLDNYPVSRSSAAEVSVIRSRTWSDAMTKEWNAPIVAEESVEEATERYSKYFSLTEPQLKSLYSSMLKEMRNGMRLHQANPLAPHDVRTCSLSMSDAQMPALPTTTEKGTACVIDFAGADVTRLTANKVTIEGHAKFSVKKSELDLNEAAPYPKGALDANATATQLFDAMVDSVRNLRNIEKIPADKDRKLPVGLVVGMSLDQKSPKSAVLRRLAKGFETGRATDDGVEGMDVGALLDCAFKRNKVEGQTVAVCTDTAALLVAGACSKLYPPCRMAMNFGSGIDGSFVLGNSEHDGYKGCVVNVGLGTFDIKLPINDIDLEIDFAQPATRSSFLFEKMIAAPHVAEICRRIVVKVWQHAAPELAWARYSMPWQACVKILMDDEPGMTTTGDILRVLWDWETTEEQRKIVHRLFNQVFDRSAALSAVCIAALAKMSDRLQPAMGGLTCAVDGILYTEVPFFDKKVRGYLETILGQDTACLIHFHVIRDGHLLGAAVLMKA